MREWLKGMVKHSTAQAFRSVQCAGVILQDNHILRHIQPASEVELISSKLHAYV